MSKIIALDNFISGPEKVFFHENQWSIPLFYEYRLYPISGNIYFFIDFLFALSIVLFIPNLYRWLIIRQKFWDKLLGNENSPTFYKSTIDQHAIKDCWHIYKKLFYFPFLYLIADVVEGILNLKLINTSDYNVLLTDYLQPVEFIKKFFLIGSLLLLFYRYFSQVEINRIFDTITGNSFLSTIKNWIKRILKLLEGNYISILISILIFYLISTNDQGKTLLLELVHSPINMIFGFIPLIIILSLMSLINSYYVNPIFYTKTKNANNGQPVNKLYFNWHLQNSANGNLNAASYTREAKGNLKRYLTLIYYLMAAVLFINLVTQQVNGPNIDFIGYVISAILIAFIFYYIWRNNKQLSKLEATQNGEDTYDKFKANFSRRTNISGLLAFIFFLGYAGLSIYDKYGYLSLKMILLFLFFASTAFHVSHLILVRRSHKNILTSFSKKIKNILAKDQNFIYFQWIAGPVILLLSIIQFFVNSDVIFNHVKSINIILIYVFLAFWIYFVISSTLLFSIQKKWTNSIIIANILFVSLICIFVYTRFWDNKYFTSKLIDISQTTNQRDTEGIALKQFLEDRLNDENSPKYYYLIANEGGGLKANYWSLLILSKLDSIGKSRGGFYENTLATSGASGGSIGQSIFNLMKAQNKGIINHEIIEDIGNMDHLASDLYSLCFRRPITSMIPIDLTDCEPIKTIRGDYYASRRYAQMATKNNEEIVSLATKYPFKKFWKEAYKNHNKKYPLTLINSTHAEYGTEGVGSPLTEKDNRKIFSSSVSYLEINRGAAKENQKQTISFIDAAFLANRFPLVSSPAIIPTKGHFIDAGAFDNNGISSLIELISYVRQKALEDAEWEKLWEKLRGKIKLIIIANGKGTYIKNEFDNFRLDKGNKLFKSGNLKNSLNAAVSTSAVKEYLQREAKKQDCVFDVIHIDLPYILKGKRTDVQNTLKIQVTDTLLDDRIENANMRIKMHLKSQNYPFDIYLDPPLGRSLSKPVTTYMRMMADSIVKQKTNEIFD